MQLNAIMSGLKSKLEGILVDVDDWIVHYRELLSNNDVVIVMDAADYNRLNNRVKELIGYRAALQELFLNINDELPGSFLKLTIAIDDLVFEIDDILKEVEKKYTENDFDVNKYFMVKRLLDLNVPDKTVVEINDLEAVIQDEKTWITAYVIEEDGQNICHCKSWKSKHEAFKFALECPHSRREYVFNRFD
jgi:uncharacterized protein YkuJ